MADEQSLARRARDGDREAFEELVRRTSRFLYARLYLETGDPQHAEDLVQETYLRAFRAIHRLEDPSGFRAWLFVIARSALIDAARRSARRRRMGRVALETLPAPAQRDEGRAEQREKVRAALQALPEEYRLPLLLRYIDGAGYDQITMQLDLSNGSLRGLLHRGLKLLRSNLKTEASDESR